MLRALETIMSSVSAIKYLKKCHACVPLKGQCHKILDFRFFSWISFPQAPEYTIRAVSYMYINVCLQVHLAWFCSHYLPPALLTPAANLPPVSLMLVANWPPVFIASINDTPPITENMWQRLIASVIDIADKHSFSIISGNFPNGIHRGPRYTDSWKK